MKLPTIGTSHGRGTIRRWMAGAITMLLIVAIFVMLTIYRPAPWLVDGTALTSSAVSHDVSQTQMTTYCPARMALSDTAAYGDAQYRSSQGNIASASRYAAFGSIYRATVSGLHADESAGKELRDSDILDPSNIRVASGDVDHGSTLVETRMLKAELGSGTASSVVSWATQGDLRGLSGTSCVTPELSQSFLLPATGGGSTQQLVVANPSTKATSVDIAIWGTKTAGAITSAVGSSLSVAAHAESTLDLGAAAPDQGGLFVTISSAQTPVAAIVRTVRMDGLTVKGSDYASPVTPPARRVSIPAIGEGDDVTLFVFGDKARTMTLSWVGGDGGAKPERRNIAGDKVSAIDLGKAPKGTSGLRVEADGPIRVDARVTNDGDAGQQDFAFAMQAASTRQSAIVVPDGVKGEMTFINTGDGSTKATLYAYDGTGKQVGTRDIALSGRASTTISDADIGHDGRLFVLRKADGMSWAMRLSSDAVKAAHAAGIAYLMPQSLDVHSERVWAKPDQTIVR